MRFLVKIVFTIFNMRVFLTRWIFHAPLEYRPTERDSRLAASITSMDVAFNHSFIALFAGAQSTTNFDLLPPAGASEAAAAAARHLSPRSIRNLRRHPSAGWEHDTLIPIWSCDSYTYSWQCYLTINSCADESTHARLTKYAITLLHSYNKYALACGPLRL